MDIINKLRNYFYGLLLISIGLTAWVIIMEANNLKIMYVDDSLINTIIASFYAVTIALWIYWRQQNDKYESLKNSLERYLDYISNKFPQKLMPKFIERGYEIEKDEKGFKPTTFVVKSFNFGVVNDGFINTIINSGYFNEILFNLIDLQSGLKLYVECRNEFLYSEDLDFSSATIKSGDTEATQKYIKRHDNVVNKINRAIRIYSFNTKEIREFIQDNNHQPKSGTERISI